MAAEPDAGRIVLLLERIEDEARRAAADAAAPARSVAESLLREALAKIETARGAAPSDANAARLLRRIASEARRIRETIEANDRKAKRESFRALAAELRSRTADAPRVPSEVLIREDRDRRHDLGSLAVTLGEWDSPEDEAAWRDL